jgi:hypothetical protein
VPPLEGETHGQLIIPELVLPAAHVVPRTSNFKVELKEEEEKVNGPTTRLLVLGPRAAAAAALCVDNPSGWVVEEDGLSVLRAEAAWRDDDSHDKSSGTLELVSLGEDVHQVCSPFSLYIVYHEANAPPSSTCPQPRTASSRPSGPSARCSPRPCFLLRIGRRRRRC